MCELTIKIKNLRNNLHFLILNKGLTDNEVLSCSQELDKLIVEYHQRITFDQQLRKIFTDKLNQTKY
ncbi:MAG: aspartyl-phosphate phosphatase Spo0E family protein [Clostridiaceae bacterium]